MCELLLHSVVKTRSQHLLTSNHAVGYYLSPCWLLSIHVYLEPTILPDITDAILLVSKSFHRIISTESFHYIHSSSKQTIHKYYDLNMDVRGVFTLGNLRYLSFLYLHPCKVNATLAKPFTCHCLNKTMNYF